MLRENGLTVGFYMEGHAGYGEYGADILCSAASAIAQTAVMGLTERIGVNLALSIDEETGIHCVLEKGETRLMEADLILTTMELGLRSLEESYGKEYLDITEREV